MQTIVLVRIVRHYCILARYLLQQLETEQVSVLEPPEHQDCLLFGIAVPDIVIAKPRFMEQIMCTFREPLPASLISNK